MPIEVPAKESIHPGHLACPGCGAVIAMRFVLKGIGDKAIMAIPACCWSIIAGPFPFTALKIPVLHTAFETGGAVASGIRAALEMKGDEETQVITWAGDGGTFDIGLQSLSGAAERNENILYICYDNEAYMNTGVQSSGATPLGTWTTTSPVEMPKSTRKKDIMQIMAAHRIPDAATASIGFPEDLVHKVQKAVEIKGTRFIHIYAPCPTGWKVPSELSVRLARLAVQSRIFPLYEVEDGTRYTLNRDSVGYLIDEYYALQGRFKHLGREQLDEIQQQVDEQWERLKKLAAL